MELCAEDLDKNILLGMSYSGPWGQTTKNLKYDQQTSSFEKVAGVFYARRGPNIAKGNDNKLLSLLKLCWHQCDYCSRLQTSLANDLFLQKCGEKYELNFILKISTRIWKNMDRHVAEVAIESLKEKRIRLAHQLEVLMGIELDEKQLKEDFYAAFIKHHRKQYPQITIGRIHEYFLKQRNALGRQAIVDVVKDELYTALGNPNSQFWEQIDLETAIDICCYARYIDPKKRRENSPIIIMNDITKRVESQLNINEEGEGTSGTITMEHAEMSRSKIVGEFPIKHFYSEEVSENIKSTKFKIGVFRTVFTVKNVNDAPEGSDKLLEDLVDHFLAKADNASGAKSEKCSIIIRSSVLEKPIQIPYRGLAQNTPQVVMEQFDAVDQSGKRMGRPSLYSQPIHIEIVMGPSHDEALELIKQGQGGMGRKSREIHQGVDINNLIPVHNETLNPPSNVHCLILAVQLKILHVNLDKTILENKKFQRLVNGQNKNAIFKREFLIKEMLQQLFRHGIRYPTCAAEYTYDEHVPMLQRYLNLRWPAKGHYYGIRNLNALFGSYYCIDCEAPYTKKIDHRKKCVAKCPRCCGMGFGFPCKVLEDFSKKCLQCLNIFKNPECYKRHIEKGICKIFKRCEECGHVYRVKKVKSQESESESTDEDVEKDNGHTCFIQFCSLCLSKHKLEEQCYVQPIVPKHNQEYLLIAFDFECELISPTRNQEYWDQLQKDNPVESLPNDENYQLHHVNCVSALLMCYQCIGNDNWKNEITGSCKICGINMPRMRTWTAADFSNPLREFLEWLINGLGNQRTGKTYAISHYGGFVLIIFHFRIINLSRYDMHLLLGELIKHFGIEPKITRTGNKLYEVLIKKQRSRFPYISFRDSFNWTMLKLEQLPKALALEIDEGGKSFFPHGWNFNKNMDVRLKGLPDQQYYYPDSMGKERRKMFEEWYTANKNEPFCLREQIVEYCQQDVRILAHALVKLQRLFFALATEPAKRDDVLVNSMTIASACIRHFCINYLKKAQMGIIPDNGYHKDTNQSAIALKYLRWLSHKTDLQIQHRESPEGEKRVRVSDRSLLRLDGYIKSTHGGWDQAIEFLGCAWHGHECLYRPHEICLNGKTSLYNKDKLDERIRLLKEAGIWTIPVWECEVMKDLEECPEMSQFFDKLPDIGPLYPRDAFHGGRTGPLSLKCDLEGTFEKDYEISCFDVVSLYPAVNFYAFYPIGHPKVLELNKNVNWTKPEDLHPFKGLFKIFIIPPDDLYLPVIPENIHGKLIFHLCRSCAVEASPGLAIRANRKYNKEIGHEWCPHKDDERGFVSTTCSVELELALKKGYRVTKASGWPSSVLVPGNPEIEDQRKKEFIERNQREYGIHLDPTRIERNEGMRYLAKTCNNSMWGRWALRCNLSQDCITSSPVELHTILNDPKLELGAVEMLAPNLFSVPYKQRREFVRPHDKYNIAVALITTATARIMLYDYMERIVKEKDCKLLYTDTDSCFYLHRCGQTPPFVWERCLV
uniref:DNA-directed DNA polymerase n=1 Tax=Meloidogyne enterolobii TaxID=390850 RepID=A0A6V7VPE4_MELEN|nr:unnamed protein product [Meloidogyne enterolobii]